MKDHYLTVGELRRVIEGLPDNSKVFYERIEDVYFKKHGWKPDKIIKSYEFELQDWDSEHIRVFTAFVHDNDLHITAHY